MSIKQMHTLIIKNNNNNNTKTTTTIVIIIIWKRIVAMSVVISWSWHSFGRFFPFLFVVTVKYGSKI